MNANTENGDSLALLQDAALNMDRIEKLRLTGTLGRWWACQTATVNFHAPYITKAKTFWGGSMEVDIREAVSSQIFTHGAYEPELSSFLHRALQPGMTFVDVGAHYGYFSLLGAHRVGEAGRVIAIEPCERTSWRLYHNVSQHKAVSHHRVAAWNEETTLSFNDYGPVWSAFNSIGERRIHESAPAVKPTSFQVRAVALDDFFAEIGVTPDVIKIDAESAELQVLGGLVKTLTNHRPLVTIEVGDYAHLVEKGVPTSAEVLRSVAAYDYVHFSPTLNGVIGHEVRNDAEYGYANVVAVPRERSAEFLSGKWNC